MIEIIPFIILFGVLGLFWRISDLEIENEELRKQLEEKVYDSGSCTNTSDINK